MPDDFCRGLAAKGTRLRLSMLLSLLVTSATSAQNTSEPSGPTLLQTEQAYADFNDAPGPYP